MAQYVKITSDVAGSSNGALRKAIIYIGKRHGKLANKEGYSSKEYFKCGRDFIAKKCGSFKKTAILRMVEPRRIKGSKAKQWCYNKQAYGKAYSYIISLLLKCPPEDKSYISSLLNMLYQDIRKELEPGSAPERLCSNALIYWQKSMLSIHEISTNVSVDERQEAGKILSKVKAGDKPLPPPY